MKRIKAIACVLAVAMLAGIFAGCSKTTKISTDKFAKACERLKLTEFDVEDDSPDRDDLEDGLYTIADADDLVGSSDTVDVYGFGDFIDPDDIKSVGMAMKFTGLDDLEDLEDPEDLEDLKVDGAFAAVIELDDNYVNDVMDYFEDMLDTYDIDVKDLTNKEYYVSKNDGYIRFHIDISKLAKIFLENEDIMDLASSAYDEDDIEEICKNISGDVAVTVEINGSNLFILAGGSFNTKPSTLNSFASAFGVASNPVKLPMNNKFVEKLVEDAIDNYGSLASSYSGGYDDDYDDDYDDYDDDDWDDWDI